MLRLVFGVSAALLLPMKAARADVEINPSASLQVIGTDNLRRQPTDPEGDVVMQSVGTVQVAVDNLNLSFLGTASLLYDAFAENSDLNRLTGSGLANARYTVIPDFMVLDASAQISDEFLDVLDQSPTGLPNGAAQNRVTNLQAGAYVTTSVGDIADVKLRGSIATVQSEELDTAPSPFSLSDSVSYGGSALVTNGERSRNLVWSIAAAVEQEERDDTVFFRSGEVTAGVVLRVTPRIRVAAKGGFEDISGAGVAEISDETWSAGLKYDIGDASLFAVEWGRRFGRESWSGVMDLRLSDRFAFGAEYSERIETQQGRFGRQLTDLFNDVNSLPEPQLPGGITPGQSLVDEVFYNKEATVTLAYAGLSESFSLTGRYSDRELSLLPQADSTAGVTAAYSEVLVKDLVLNLSGAYDTVVESTINADGDRMVGSGSLSYRLGEGASASFQYTWSRTETTDTVTENVVSAGLTHNF